MSPKGNHYRSNQKAPVASGALADCILPKDLMICILTRLPVKSIHRFKSVCKPWCKRFSTAKFMKMHHAQLSENLENQAVIIYSLDGKQDHSMSLFQIESNEAKITKLDHPFPQILYGMDFVGSCYGLLCLSYPSNGKMVSLWNPSLNLRKYLPLPNLEVRDPETGSLGFLYDSEGGDFKVVRIISRKELGVVVEVYSCNSDSWTTIELDFPFGVLGYKNSVVVNGNPYWFAMIDDTKVDGNMGLVWFDVREMVFKVVPHSHGLDLEDGENVEALVDWKGALAVLVCKKNDERVSSLDVWVSDDVGIWRKHHSFGPIDLKVHSFLQCSKSGKIIGECLDGKLFVFDPENGGCVKEIVIDEAQNGSFQIYRYTESLACVKGMCKEEVKTEEEIQKEEEEIDCIVDKLMMYYTGPE
ncbi:hypothetical protein OROGR_029395 [Orobanche gracilis]